MNISISIWFFLIVWLVIAVPAKSQNSDSLRHLISLQEKDTTEVDALNRLAQTYYYSKDDSTRVLAELANKLASEIKYTKGRSHAFHHLATYYSIRSELDSALVYYEKSIEAKSGTKDSLLIAGTLNNLGATYYKKGNYTAALKAYQRALKLRLDKGDSARAAYTLGNIGLIYLDQKNYDLSLNYFNQTLDIQKSISDLDGQAAALSNIGTIYLGQENYGEALIFCKKAYDIFSSIGEKCQSLTPASNLGRAYLMQNQKEKALKYLELVYTEAKDCDNPVLISLASLEIGIIHAEKKLFQQAEREMLESYLIAERHELKEKMQKSAHELYVLYQSIGNTSKALEFLEISDKIKDQMFNEDLTEQLTRMELNFAFEQERDSLEFQKQSELVSIHAKLKQQHLIQYATIIGLMLAIIAVIVIFRYYILSQKAKNKLAEALDEREVLLREIHHRVKNNLQVVSSLLNVQSKYLNDELAKKAVLEGRNRVQSMAIVHEKLYQSDNLSNINVKEYLEELANTLFKSYDISEDRVKLSSKIENVELTIDTTIQIGLIINELISNALKHAFPENKIGAVCLSLRKKNNVHELEVSDNGVGIASPDDLLKSYGYRIVRSISKGLNGNISIQHEKGTRFLLTF
ncbi:Two-component sensor histidine kinase, contains HisKA and HATPase domains [Reichenbachiella faecimaris]|uniref:histidine kinase n=1 Tax=Reichenbachiella faecimaris TaxID=692418 RepID=A0A1W2G855_REIFA|nr:tetratricopeptide repeat protein [Reichenbachiella faecimaris]SMD32791.1 Two-component sensor histidine kinase, contains HisKA and HATPase domains [Reichenbachiella faecimaris]